MCNDVKGTPSTLLAVLSFVRIQFQIPFVLCTMFVLKMVYKVVFLAQIRLTILHKIRFDFVFCFVACCCAIASKLHATL